ncbi:HNH endonuclease [Flavobacterium sp.]|uniref:HNH endonuclease signature motif containing protein n=1 Tax=Flavobacterium sp. TaxID=239 RepID=UPI0039C87EF5
MSVNYRKIAFDAYPPICAYCGFGIKGILQVSHLNHNRKDNSQKNLVILCPTCHKMYDGNLISRDALIVLRDNPRKINWSASMKDAGIKAAKRRKARAAGRKAAQTRLKNLQAKVVK